MTSLAPRRFALACALLTVVHSGPAGAQPSLTPLIKPLDLVAYASGTTPPDFEGDAADAARVALHALRGRVVLVNFWATWCTECRPEMPVLERLHRELSPRGLSVVGVNAREEAGVVRRYAREMGVTFPLVLDPGGTINARYGVVGIPTTFLVARDGRAVAFGVGPREWGGAAGRTLIEALLDERAPRAIAP